LNFQLKIRISTESEHPAAVSRLESELQSAVKGIVHQRGRCRCRSEPYRSYVEGLQQKGIRTEMAHLTLARKIAAVALRVWKKGETFDPKKLNST